MKFRILLLEDDPASRAFLAAAAEQLPAHVDVVDTLSEARRLLNAYPFHLWLFDVNLPDGRGADLVAELRAQGLRTPAIAHTAAHEPDNDRVLRNAGFDAVLTKPLSVEALLEAIRAVMASTRPPDNRVFRDDPDTDHDEDAVWDEQRAARALNGDLGNVDSLRGLFLAELPAQRDAIIAGDAEVRRQHLHRLRASCGFVGANRLDEAARRLHADPDDIAAMMMFMDAVNTTLQTPP